MAARRPPGDALPPLLFGLTVDVRAQPADEATNLVVDTWQIDAGLPHNSVTALLQTKDGYLWVGTSNGLARFDGIRFTAYRVVDNPGLKSNRILCLHEDAQGVLWIGTDEGGLASCRSGQFSSLGTAEGLSSDTVLCLGDDQGGDLWVGTASGLNRLRDGQFTTFFKPDGLPDDRVGAIGQPPGAPMVIATGKGLCQFSGERLGLYGAVAWTQTQSNLCCLHTDREGQLWVGGELGLFRLPATGMNSVDPPAKLSSASVLCLAERAEGGIWFGTSAGDLWRAAPGATNNLGSQRVWHFPNPVTALREDREGNLWAGTAGDGLHRLKRRQLQLVPLAERLGQRWAPCVLETADAELRLVAGDKGIYRLQGGRLTLLERLPLPDGVAVQTVCATRTGGLWIGTLRDGLFECGKGVLNQFSERDGLSDSAIEVLCAEPDGALWVGTRNGGLNHFKDRVVRRFGTPWGFTGNYACALEQDSQGGLWIGTCGDGLFQLKQGRFIAYTETNGLPSREIRALHADPDGSLWVGTSSGLCRVKDERVSSFTVRQGLAEEAIFSYAVTTKGTCGSVPIAESLVSERINSTPAPRGGPASSTWCLMARKTACRGCSACRRSNPDPAGALAGWLWFSTTKGLVIFPRRGLQRNTLPPPVVIEHVFVENEDVPLNASIRVAPGKENLRFRYTTLSFTAPGKVSFRYQLEGFDRDWSEVSFSRTARYPKVPPGRYVFRVLARNNDGIWNATGASVAIVGCPLLVGDDRFRLAGALAAMAALGSLFRLRQHAAAGNRGLRVRIASDLHDDVVRASGASRS